jgi:tRNA (mo5U34)-methyltransferase
VDVEELARRVKARPWFHKIDLGNGIITPGSDESALKLPHMHMPGDLTGKRVIDIGAYDGFYSFEAERRGASHVLATDYFCWMMDKGHLCDGEGFRIAHQALRSKVEQRYIRAEELCPEKVGMADLVLFLGVLYHAPDPLLYLRAARSVCNDMLILESHIDAVDIPAPAMIFYPGATLNNDPSNCWGPNVLCIAEMLKEVGFSKLTIFPPYHSRRVVIHAFV